MLVDTFFQKGPTSFFEEEARARGYRLVAGLDEAGRGPLAGPVVGAAVVLPRRVTIPHLDDSKQVSLSQREELFDQVITQAVAWGIGQASEQEIDRYNILEATRLAWSRAVHALHLVPDFLVIDGTNVSRIPIPQRTIIKGDQLSLSIAAASILAKVQRDRFMDDYHQQYPWYNFHIHKGYPTPEHLTLLDKYGPCVGHRRSFRPVRDRELGLGGDR
ncbi:MAG: ribonuclease HII [Nitrospirae bacterium]|nr:ribonuclease HII [Nitrospirota bacterium]